MADWEARFIDGPAPVLAELEPWQRAYVTGFLDGMRGRTESSPPPIDITIGVDDSRFRSAMYQAIERLQRLTDVPLAHFGADVVDAFADIRDEVGLWERSRSQNWEIGFGGELVERGRFEAYVGDLRDEFGQAVAEHEPTPCGWHRRDGFRLGGVAADVERLPSGSGGGLW